MYNQKKFEQIKPRGSFRTEWYRGRDAYSDGDVEDRIIDIIMDSPSEDYSGPICRNFSWPVFYHLTHLRRNILNWYPFRKDSDLLEIGCGLGAITDMLCERCGHVTAVELSKRRATAAWLRCRERENLEIIVGNLNDIEFEKRFDYITLIGVLEYQGTYTKSENPYRDFLVKVRGLLKPGGRLLVAIENKHGLKYWCGAREDHTGLPYDGVNDYRIGNQNARTFSRSELKDLLRDSGFGDSYFYYPMPDYKLPTVVYSQDYLPRSGNMENMSPYYIPDSSTLLVREQSVWGDVVENGAFEFLANSFLVECASEAEGEKERAGEVLFASLSSERKRAWRVGTLIRRDGWVEKFALEKAGQDHIAETETYMRALRERALNVLPFERTGGVLRSPRSFADTLEDRLLRCYRKRDKEAVWELWDLLYGEIGRSSDTADPGENILLKRDAGSGEDFGPILKCGYVDMIARNCFMEERGPVWFDQEWMLAGVPQKYIFYKSLHEMYPYYPWMEEIVPLGEVMEHFGITGLRKSFEQLESFINYSLMDFEHLRAAGSVRNVPADTYANNILKLIRGAGEEEGEESDADTEKIIGYIDRLLTERKYAELREVFGDMEEDESLPRDFRIWLKIIRQDQKERREGREPVLERFQSFGGAVAYFRENGLS